MEYSKPGGGSGKRRPTPKDADRTPALILDAEASGSLRKPKNVEPDTSSQPLIDFVTRDYENPLRLATLLKQFQSSLEE
jgi:hypothetical protein